MLDRIHGFRIEYQYEATYSNNLLGDDNDFMKPEVTTSKYDISDQLNMLNLKDASYSQIVSVVTHILPSPANWTSDD